MDGRGTKEEKGQRNVRCSKEEMGEKEDCEEREKEN